MRKLTYEEVARRPGSTIKVICTRSHTVKYTHRGKDNIHLYMKGNVIMRFRAKNFITGCWDLLSNQKSI